ncbi:MAG: tRNA (N6-isopentenyl adenosine(37)-C2)-methylthiotransferase MiaB [Fusobacterium perfoetens]|uniref:tRNA (N6-isopentenyl adenosine(37)-C2)-methylthiotransferase MiaB n=1 Tax=Fusobacterium perfoetens TaxID=852 RepID=UPI0023F349F3|nr:tRNA (N6-isopentenyl adenosine(37)-C2)-methylthiotransferase MiaB [Fusobacterium perfoetens]MCI6151830.1 tRNA (N6-isopentenyl adenosine(37)-C2)-methylthiotransferase MiaB [Fusobacterium perfoetens]MDY3236809.1 tRNA (N6-isopentenyl adenosine(37)-C2)-methylthiotransferase MiaB [Fusobacterium perfoetens]
MKKNATVITYGCQMNVNESAKIRKIMENLDYNMTEDIESTDVVFLNTCTVREGAATQIYGKLGDLKRVRDKRGTKIIITGCFAQEQGKKLLEKFPYIDIIMGNQNIGRIPEALDEIESNKKVKHVILTEYEEQLPPRIDADFDNKITASISIGYGCNNFCTYCIVPYVRGRERYVPMVEIVEQTKEFIKKGYKEIMLLAQNVNSYGRGLSKEETFANLLQNICDIDGDFIVRFVSPHPRDFTDDVIDVIAKNPKIARCLHIPLQSGSSRILKLMNRGYTKEQYLALIEKIKTRIPDIAITTDIIVGFPQETEEDFLDTLDVVRKSKYDTAFMFMYSIRQGTKAAEMDGHLSDDIKHERLQRLIALQTEISKEISETYAGKVERVLVEGPSKKNKDVLSSRTSTNKIVLFEGDKSLEGHFVDVKINECKTWTLYGELVQE